MEVSKNTLRKRIDWITVTLTLGRLVVFGVRYGIQALRLLGEKKKLRKGGAEE